MGPNIKVGGDQPWKGFDFFLNECADILAFLELINEDSPRLVPATMGYERGIPFVGVKPIGYETHWEEPRVFLYRRGTFTSLVIYGFEPTRLANDVGMKVSKVDVGWRFQV